MQAVAIGFDSNKGKTAAEIMEEVKQGKTRSEAAGLTPTSDTKKKTGLLGRVKKDPKKETGRIELPQLQAKKTSKPIFFKRWWQAVKAKFSKTKTDSSGRLAIPQPQVKKQKKPSKPIFFKRWYQQAKSKLTAKKPASSIKLAQPKAEKQKGPGFFSRTWQRAKAKFTVKKQAPSVQLAAPEVATQKRPIFFKRWWQQAKAKFTVKKQAASIQLATPEVDAQKVDTQKGPGFLKRAGESLRRQKDRVKSTGVSGVKDKAKRATEASVNAVKSVNPNYRLLQAVARGDAKLVEKIFNSPVSKRLIKRAYMNKGVGFIHVARDMNTIEVLVKNGIDINMKDKSGQTLLHHLTVARKSDLIEPAIKQGADVNIADKKGLKPLEVAFHVKLGEAASVFLEHMESSDFRNKTLQAALEHGDDKLTERLIQKGAPALKMSSLGRSNLHRMIELNKHKLVQEVFKQANSKELAEFVENSIRISEFSSKASVLVAAVHTESANMVRVVSNGLADVSKAESLSKTITDKDFSKVINRINKKQSYEVFEQIINSKLAAELLPRFGGVFLSTAVELDSLGGRSSSKLTEAIVEKRLIDLSGFEQLKIGKEYLLMGNVQDKLPLHRAVELKNLQVAQALARAGMPIDAKNKQGQTPLDLVPKGDTFFGPSLREAAEEAKNQPAFVKPEVEQKNKNPGGLKLQGSGGSAGSGSGKSCKEAFTK